MSITYQVERWNSVVCEMAPFAPLHWEEIALDHNAVPLDMNWNKYREMDKSGMLHLVTARDDGKIIGYHVSMIGGHLHYKSTLHASVDLYFVKQEYRKGRIGIKLFKFTEESLKAIGVQKIVTGTKVHKDNSRLFEYLGYHNTEIIFTKLI